MNFTNNGVLLFKISATTIKEGPYQSGKVAMHLGRKGKSCLITTIADYENESGTEY